MIHVDIAHDSGTVVVYLQTGTNSHDHSQSCAALVAQVRFLWQLVITTD
jgi:hypothetical protein